MDLLDGEFACLDSRRDERDQDSRRYVVIGSAGRSGTQWIATALNIHEQIFVAHGPDLQPQKLRSKSDRVRALQRNAASLTQGAFPDFDDYFDILEAQGDYGLYANIHGLVPRSARFRRAYFMCALVRDPVLRVRSFVNKWKAMYESGGAQRDLLALDALKATRTPRGEAMASAVTSLMKRLQSGKRSPGDMTELAPLDRLHRERLDAFKLLAKRGRADGSDVDTILFVKAVDTILHYQRYYRDLGIPLYQSEELLAGGAGFQRFFAAVTGDQLPYSPAYKAKITGLSAIDRSTGGDPASAKEVFSGWPSWQRRYFCQEVERAEMTEFFRAWGYLG